MVLHVWFSCKTFLPILWMRTIIGFIFFLILWFCVQPSWYNFFTVVLVLWHSLDHHLLIMILVLVCFWKSSVGHIQTRHIDLLAPQTWITSRQWSRLVVHTWYQLFIIYYIQIEIKGCVLLLIVSEFIDTHIFPQCDWKLSVGYIQTGHNDLIILQAWGISCRRWWLRIFNRPGYLWGGMEGRIRWGWMVEGGWRIEEGVWGMEEVRWKVFWNLSNNSFKLYVCNAILPFWFFILSTI